MFDNQPFMIVYISILRGINVGGHNKVRMEDLKALFESLGYNEVKTYIQSGNVIFKADQDQLVTVIAQDIEKAIESKYHFVVPVIIRSADNIQSIIALNPFLREPGIDREKLHVTFLSEEPAATAVKAIQKYGFPPDRFRIMSKEVYLSCPGGYGNTKLSNTFFENKLLVKATTRNWNTVLKLSDLTNF
jgi:uncharacterized protein (DUF1697 family)